MRPMSILPVHGWKNHTIRHSTLLSFRYVVTGNDCDWQELVGGATTECGQLFWQVVDPPSY